MPSPHVPARRRAFWPRVLLAVVVPLAFFALLEGGLRLGGFGRDPRFFIPDAQPGQWRTNPRFTETYFPASFGLKPANFRLTKRKAPGTTRIFVLGESAAMGVPEPAFGLAPQLQAQLRAARPDEKVEVFNLAVTAINSHVVREIARQAVDFEPDLLVIYLGNNEVVGPYGPSSVVTVGVPPRWLIRTSLALRSSRTGQLLERIVGVFRPRGAEFKEWGGMEMFAGKTVATDDPRLGRVYEHFAANVAAILELAAERGIKVVLSTVAVNIRDCAPFASAGAKSAEEAFQRGRAAEARGDPSGARTDYLEALELDALRFRADARINAIIRDAAQGRAGRVALADASRALGSDAGSSVRPAGRELFFEHVHLTWEGNHALARILAEAATGTLGTAPARWLDPLAAADALGFTPFARLAQLQAMDELTNRPPFTGQSTFGPDRARLEREIAQARQEVAKPGAFNQARSRLEAAMGRRPKDPDAPLLFQAAKVQLLNREYARAVVLHDRLAKLVPFSAEIAAHKAACLPPLGRTPEAEQLLLRAIAEEPYYYQSYPLLARLWADADRLPHALERFAAWVAEMPTSRVIRGTYAQLLARAGKEAEAEQQWREMLARVPDDESALDPLTSRLAHSGRLDAAVELMQRAFAHNPRNYANNARLLEVAARRGDAEGMLRYMRALEASGSVNAKFHYDVAAVLSHLGRTDERQAALETALAAARAEGNSQLTQEVEQLLREGK
ncbi:MAG TPA: hypothetical protein VEB66_03595 [Opitutaceae bacterium]|nr:hypothetical protein [Opitutaceae bacterium]